MKTITHKLKNKAFQFSLIAFAFAVSSNTYSQKQTTPVTGVETLQLGDTVNEVYEHYLSGYNITEAEEYKEGVRGCGEIKASEIWINALQLKSVRLCFYDGKLCKLSFRSNPIIVRYFKSLIDKSKLKNKDAFGCEYYQLNGVVIKICTNEHWIEGISISNEKQMALFEGQKSQSLKLQSQQ